MDRKHLRLRREALTDLDAVELGAVAGAGPTDAESCLCSFTCTATETVTARTFGCTVTTLTLVC